jgi:cytochrome c
MSVFRNIILPVAALIGALAASSASMAESFGTRDEAVALVKTVKGDIQKKGLDAVAQDINDKKYTDRDLYPFIFKFDGVAVAHGSTKAMVGKNFIELKDPNGKFLIKALIDTAKSPGSGWVDYSWANPVTKKVESKSTYVEKIDDNDMVGVGVYVKP